MGYPIPNRKGERTENLNSKVTHRQLTEEERARLELYKPPTDRHGKPLKKSFGLRIDRPHTPTREELNDIWGVD